MPLTSLNLIGGDNITISGSNFPYDLANNEIDVHFMDEQKTKCIPEDTNTNELVCMTQGFNEETSKSAEFAMSITINGLDITNTLKGTMKPSTKSGYSLTPSSASPVLKTKIRIQVEETFQYELNRNDFTVNATRTTNSSYVKYLNIVAVDDKAKTMDVMFGGAHSGLYDLRIRHNTFGLIKTSRLLLTVGATVSSISPNKASKWGGTLMTIVGTNFGKEKTDNPVSIVYNGALGATPCYVQTTEATKITCRLDEKINKTEGDKGEVVVFLKTSEEAPCASAICKNFEYTTAIPTVSAMNTTFDAAAGSWDITLTGSDYPTTTDGVEFYVGTSKQVVKSITATSLVVSVSNVTDATFSASRLYFPVGKPNGASIVAGKVELTPKLMEISPSSGSTGGSLITAKIAGVGAKTTGLELVDSAGASICEKVTIVKYGEVQCLTKAQEIPAASAIQVKHASKVHECANTDASKCKYEQLKTASFPEVLSLTKTSSVVVFTGKNFLTSNFNALTILAGIKADSVTIDSDTQVTATWNKGVPPISTA